MAVRGFALIEFSMAIGAKLTHDPMKFFEDAKKAIDAGKQPSLPDIRAGGQVFQWPDTVKIRDVRVPIKLIFGVATFSAKFNVLVDLESSANTTDAFIPAFEYLHHLCHVEGFGG